MSFLLLSSDLADKWKAKKSGRLVELFGNGLGYAQPLPFSSFLGAEILGWTFRISSGVSQGIDKSVVQSDWEFLRIGVDGRR